MRNIVSGADAQKSNIALGAPDAEEYYVACGELFGLNSIGQRASSRLFWGPVRAVNRISSRSTRQWNCRCLASFGDLAL